MKTISTLGQLQARTANLRRLENDLAVKGQEVSTGKPKDLGKEIGPALKDLLALRSAFKKDESYLASINVFERRADIMTSAMSGIESAAVQLQSVLVTNVPDASQTVGAVGVSADALLATVVSNLNTTLEGRFLFSGAAIDQPALTEINTPSALTGLSPQDVIDGILDGTAYTPAQPAAFVGYTAAEAAAAITRFDEVFDGTNAGAPAPLNDFSFERTFFGGVVGGPDVSVRIDATTTRDYGVSAEETAFRDLMQGAMMLQSVDLVAMANTPAYEPYVTAALDKMSAGLDGLRSEMAELGGVQQEAETRKAVLQAQKVVLNEQINALENVDQLEAQTRFTEIEKQIEASYAATVRLSRLRLSNFL